MHLRRAVWLVFLLSFLGAGIDGWRRLHLETYLRDEPRATLNSFTRDASSDGYIREFLITEGVPANTISNPTETIRTALTTLPREGALIVVVPRDVLRYKYMYFTIKHLSLPRYAYYVPCDNPVVAGIPAGERIAAVISYLVEPPPTISGHWRLLPRLALTPASETEAWKPYCSR